MVIPLTLGCLVAITNQFGFPTETLFALLLQEGGREGLSSPNRNGTHDYGPFQVNDVHVPTIARTYGLTEQDARDKLRDDGCFNAQVAGALLANHWRDTGDIWAAIGRYHSRTEHLASRYKSLYLDKVKKLYQPAPQKKVK